MLFNCVVPYVFYCYGAKKHRKYVNCVSEKSSKPLDSKMRQLLYL